jgi:hypothetical protein
MQTKLVALGHCEAGALVETGIVQKFKSFECHE